MKATMKTSFSSILALLCLAVFAEAAPVPAAAGLTTSYLYSLADFNGTVPYTWARMHLEEKTGELYVVDGSSAMIRIYNRNGMETYSFGTEALGRVQDIAVDPGGNILLLVDDQSAAASVIVQCNFRGDFLARITVAGVPPGGPVLRPDTLLQQNGRLYLADRSALQVLVTDLKGHYEDRYDLRSLLRLDAGKKSGADIAGFTVDGEGNMLFTVPVLFTAYHVSPDRQVKSFGRPGSAPGKFNIVGGIAVDGRGYCYVADVLRSVVMVFDNAFNFVMEFGHRGAEKENLVGPRDMTIGSNGLLYVTQLAKRGVSVFRITYN